MSTQTDGFVSRENELETLRTSIQKAIESDASKIHVINVFGPAGCGKTTLFRHAEPELRDIFNRNDTIDVYLDGRSTFEEAHGWTQSCLAPALKYALRQSIAKRISLRDTTDVCNYLNTLQLLSLDEYKKDTKKSNKTKKNAGAAMATAIRLIGLMLRPHKVVEKDTQALENAILRVLATPDPFWERLGTKVFGKMSRANIKKNPLGAMSEAIKSDLSEFIDTYVDTFNRKPSICIVIDDYESLDQEIRLYIAEHLIVSLQALNVTVAMVFIGRDDLRNTDPVWGQTHRALIKEIIRIKPFDFADTQALCNILSARHNVTLDERAIREVFDLTRGYPWLVEQVVATFDPANGEIPFVVLQRFYDRTCQWMSEEQRGWLNDLCFFAEVPVDVCIALYKEDGQRAWEWLAREQSIRDPDAGRPRVIPLIAAWTRQYIQGKLGMMGYRTRLERCRCVAEENEVRLWDALD